MFTKFFVLLLCIGAITCFPKIDSRVVGGTEAKEGEFPYIVSLRTSKGSHNCGGSIINSKWIVTAAHCVQSAMTIQYGVNTITNDGTNVIKIKRSIKHKEYSPLKNHLNDIALLELETEIPMSERVRQVRLPGQKQEFEHGTPSVLAGWGRDKTGGSVQTNLQRVDLIVFSDEECTTRHNGRTKPSQICGGIPEGGKGQCNGDSGGPMTINGVLVGIVSWSIKPCTVAPYPGVYTKVSHYIDWINENVSN